jgi:RNA polymerase sigma-70 factor (ECF subfamily)
MLDAILTAAPRLEALSDAGLVDEAQRRNPDALRLIMRRHNRRLFRVARSVLRDDAEAEDVVQEVYVRAFGALASFRAESSLATWLTRIALNEALGRLRRQRTTVELAALDGSNDTAPEVIPFPLMRSEPDPEEAAARRQIRELLEHAIDALAEPFRLVFVMRDVEGLSVEETAAQLRLKPETVRTRLFRARAQLRRMLDARLATALDDAFPFAGARCARLAEEVLARLQVAESRNADQPQPEDIP